MLLTSVMSLKQNSLSQALPTQLARITAIDRLQLFSNALSNSIPTQFGLGFSKLPALYSNSLSKGLPSQLGQVVW